MPEIGQTLRETRMRNRIDITEVEAGTKIRAKYLRALENEEWDLLPGPTFVKTFLRSYADYLGLDSRQLVEEYKQRFERPSTMELTPFARGPGPRRERRRSRALLGPGLAVVFVLVLILGALYALGSWGDDGSGGGETSAETPTATPAEEGQEAEEARGAHACHPPDRAHRDRQRLPRRCRRQDADQQPGPAGRQQLQALPRQAVPRVVRQRPGEAQGGQAHDRRTGSLDPDRLRRAARQAPARAVRVAPADLLVRATRAGILITGTEVLSGIISDRNGPWLSERLREHGIELAPRS